MNGNNGFQLDEDLEELMRNVENDVPMKISEIESSMKNLVCAVRELTGIVRSLEEDILRYEEEIGDEE